MEVRLVAGRKGARFIVDGTEFPRGIVKTDPPPYVMCQSNHCNDYRHC